MKFSLPSRKKNIEKGNKNDIQVEVQNKDISLIFKTQVKLELE